MDERERAERDALIDTPEGRRAVPRVKMKMHRITATVDNLTTYNATLMRGHTGDCPVDRARELIGKGLAVPADEAIDVPGLGRVEPSAVEIRDDDEDETETMRSPARQRAERQIKKG